MRRWTTPLLLLMAFAALTRMAAGCDGCCMSRVEYYVPTYRVWM